MMLRNAAPGLSLLMLLASCGSSGDGQQIDAGVTVSFDVSRERGLQPVGPDGGIAVVGDATNPGTAELSVRQDQGHIAGAKTVTFDFDTGTPALWVSQSIPLDQTTDGVTAHFSSPAGAVFSVQDGSSTGYKLSQFSGRYLWDNNLNRNALDISFSQPVRQISLTFATADFGQNEVPTTVQLTAYQDAVGSLAVKTVTAHGTYAGDTMPMGTVSLSSTQPFSSVEMSIPQQALGTSVFLVDNVAVTMVP